MPKMEVPSFVMQHLVDFILIFMIFLMIFAVVILHLFENLILYISLNIGYIAIYYFLALLFISLFLLEQRKKLYLKRALKLGIEIFIGIVAIAFLPHLLATMTPYDYSVTLNVGVGQSIFSSYVTSIHLISIQNIPLSGNFVFGVFSPTIVIVKAYCPNLVSVGTAEVNSIFQSSVEVTVPGLSQGETCNFVAYVSGTSQTVELTGVKI